MLGAGKTNIVGAGAMPPPVIITPIRVISAPQGIDSYSTAAASAPAAVRTGLGHPLLAAPRAQQDRDLLRWSDDELMDLHRAKGLAAAVGYEGPLDMTGIVKLNDSKRSHIEIDAIESILGKRCRISDYIFAQVPPALEPLRDRLYYLLLARMDEGSAQGRISSADYYVGRTNPTLCFYDGERRMVALIPDSKIEGFFPPTVEEPSTASPDIEAAALPGSRAVSVLDAGIGRSKVIDLVAQRLRRFGKDVKTYGIGLTALAGEVKLSAPAFVGRFEDFDFPTQFDLIYSQVGSSFYTPNVPRYIAKLRSILRPGGAALLDVYRWYEWERALGDAGLDFAPLYSIRNLAWIDDKMMNPNNKTSPRMIEKLGRPTGVLIRKE